MEEKKRWTDAKMFATFGQNLHKGGEVVGDNPEYEDADAMEREMITLLLTQGDAKVALPGLTTKSPEQQLISTQCQQSTKKQEQTSLQRMQEQLQLQKEACSILQHQNRLFHAEHAHQKQLCQRLKMLHENLRISLCSKKMKPFHSNTNASFVLKECVTVCCNRAATFAYANRYVTQMDTHSHMLTQLKSMPSLHTYYSHSLLQIESSTQCCEGLAACPLCREPILDSLNVFF